ncbi:MAG: hypothetical protein OXP69_13160 [Spirochaetaceae bacterium]|nr:hypothetical protein [Spirochaetaceae bacterium]
MITPASILNGKPDSPRINFIRFRIVSNGEVTYRNAWVTDWVPSAANVAQLVRAGRARWTIENEGFNTLKSLMRGSILSGPLGF